MFPPAKGLNLWALPASRKAERRSREVFMLSQSALDWSGPRGPTWVFSEEVVGVLFRVQFYFITSQSSLNNL